MKWYPNTATEAGFPIGGIGTGTVTLGSDGDLRDWEIFNRPNKGGQIGYGFFALHVEGQDKRDTRILRSRKTPPYSQARGYHPGWLYGMPCMERSRLSVEYPFADLEFEDDSLPVKVTLTAFNPFIPLQAEDSGIPAALFRYKIKNESGIPLRTTVAASLPNLAGYLGNDEFENMLLPQGARNRKKQQGGIRGLLMENPSCLPEHPRTGSMAILTGDPEGEIQETWLTGGWWDGMEDFWHHFSQDGSLGVENTANSMESWLGPHKNLRVGSVGITHMLQPGEEKTFEFVLSWYYPNRIKSWDEDTPWKEGEETEKNYYASRYQDAWEAGADLLCRLPELEKTSRLFTKAIYESTLPEAVIEAVCANITALRSTTCFRIADGTFLAYEGSHERKGSCPGTCTHVWNYAQTVAWLFPELERSARRIEFGLETRENGCMPFRNERIFGSEPEEAVPAADGQFGTVVRLYREWLLSGEEEFLKELWPKAKKALEYGIRNWDPDEDGMLSGRQHNTYDIEFYGTVPMLNSIYYAALAAGEKMAIYFGEEETAERWRELRQKGSKKMDQELWNGAYYIQKLEDIGSYRFQYGEGCLADQILGQFFAHVNRLGYLFPKDHVRQAVYSIYENNYRDNFIGAVNAQRAYAMEEDKGLVLCSWPQGNRPVIPFCYSEEVWTGVEYQVASHLIYEGYMEEGVRVVEAVRSRYDGFKRNPWNEVECGNHYARSMSSYGLLLALSGFHADVPNRELSFSPKTKEKDFSCFFCCGSGWGIYRQSRDDQGRVTRKLEPLFGNLEGFTLKGGEQ